MTFNTTYCLKTHAYKDIQHAQKNQHRIRGCSNTEAKGRGAGLRQRPFKCFANVLLLKLRNEQKCILLLFLQFFECGYLKYYIRMKTHLLISMCY